MFNKDFLIGLPIEQAEKLLKEEKINYNVTKIEGSEDADSYLVVRVDDSYKLVCMGFKLKV